MSIYFELNHWSTEQYPAEEPFLSWMSDCYETAEEEEKSWIREPEIFDKYCKDNGLIVGLAIIDMSLNFCVTATDEWVQENCPTLLDERNRKFLRELDEDGSFGYPCLSEKEFEPGLYYFTNVKDKNEAWDYIIEPASLYFKEK